jgi:hypothetical protein
VKARELLFAGFVLFTALLVWPLLSIANRPVLVAGIPSLVLYLFVVWTLIVLALFAVRPRKDGDGGP